jgi:hypothetical protein
MLENFIDYDKYFHAGLRIKLSIPLSGGEVFREWAVVENLELNLISLRMSRSLLPEHVQISIGSILEVRMFGEASSYCCRGIVISEYDGSLLLMELISEVISSELREYFRIGVFLPIKMQRPADQDNDKVKDEWMARRRLLSPLMLEGEESLRMAGLESDWNMVLPTATNISGGGMRCKFSSQVYKGDMVHLEIFLPLTPPRTITVVGKVVYVNEVVEESTPLWDTALHFLFVEERDRDAIINYISEVELRRIREFKKSYLNYSMGQERPQTNSGWERLLIRGFYIIIVVFTLYYLINALLSYHHHHEKHVIEKSFEDSVREYAKKKRAE